MPFAAARMDLETITLSEVSQKGKEKYRMIALICGTYTMTQMNQSTKHRQTHRHREQTCGCQRGGGTRGGEDWELGINRYKFLYTD